MKQTPGGPALIQMPQQYHQKLAQLLLQDSSTENLFTQQ